jgi:transcription-repair coupling factor (superfamily II helicase)
VSLRDLLRRFSRTGECGAIARAIREGRDFTAGGLWGSADAFLLAALPRDLTGTATLVVTPDEDAAEDVAQDLRLFLGDPGAVRAFPAFDTFDGAPPAIDFATLSRRLLLLQMLLDREHPAWIVAPAAALVQPTVSSDLLHAGRRRVAIGDRLDLEAFARELAEARFTRAPMVEAPGEFSIRGGILDVFPISREAPYRVELFGDEVESIRQFEPATQRSVAQAEAFQLTVMPPRDLAHPKGGASLIDYLPEGHLLVLLEENRIREWVAQVDARTDAPGLLRRLEKLLKDPGAVARLGLTTRPVDSSEDGVRVPVHSVTGGAKNLEDLEELLEEVVRANRLTLLFANNTAEVARLSELLDEATFPGVDSIEVRAGRLSRSFQLPKTGLAVLSHDDLFDRYRLRRVPRRAPSIPVQDFVDLKPGDHVVHLSHGIGIYRGIERIVKRGVTEEFLKVEFAGSVRVFVPVSKANLVQKYVGSREFRPRLSKVGGVTWSRQKDRVREAVKDMAAELLELQAVRAAKPGIAYPTDDRMQREFEGSFLYEDTPDQIEAMSSIKEDMQVPRPMDRLLCGDVGYGKTELAVRAAFKTVAAEKQVAVLVPTTVLAQQHYQTFSERLVDYPVLLEVLSRFRSRKQQQLIVSRTSQGLVDILIGTHRLLSPDVRFADLGLVIVDEEQRFGVEHKTRLRQLRRTVDVLTMTATPIPRTLHMSLLGIKDISTLATAPQGRQSIQTEVVNFDEALIRRGILREMNRSGQVFFVHNRVETIDRASRRLGRLVPEARFAVVHGQMNESELESRMLAFIRGEVDVLVTTTIIESGLDIPNANTIFIDRADRFGLAELHQLRGRVGRYRHRAYCYLVLPKHRVSTVAERRIRAVEEFQELGAGFRIAMRDLEIRGAGNILGTQQSGHIAAVGYDLYCQLLEDAVRELKDEPRVDRIDPFVEIDVGAHLPADYVPDERQRIEVYRKLARASSEEALSIAVAEVEDRFGRLPEPARLLLELARVRILAARLHVEHLVRAARDRVLLRPRDMQRLTRRLQRIRDRVRVVDERTVHLLLEDPSEDGFELLADLRNALSGPRRRP